MKNRILVILALVAVSYNSFAQVSAPATTQQATVSPTGEAMLYLIKGIHMTYINKNWNNAGAWIQSTTTVTDPAAASKLMGELSANISDNAFLPTFVDQKSKWTKTNAKVSSNSALKQSLKTFAAGIKPAAFIPEFNMSDWNYMLDKL